MIQGERRQIVHKSADEKPRLITVIVRRRKDKGGTDGEKRLSQVRPELGGAQR